MPQETKEDRENSIKAAIYNHSVHEMAQTGVGLLSLMRLQYEHEGHLDVHVGHLLMDVLCALELRLSNPPQADSVDDVPF